MPKELLRNLLAICWYLISSVVNSGDGASLPGGNAKNEPRGSLLTAESQEVMAGLKFLVGALEFVRSRRTSELNGVIANRMKLV